VLIALIMIGCFFANEPAKSIPCNKAGLAQHDDAPREFIRIAASNGRLLCRGG
jgi:hypothetical protein